MVIHALATGRQSLLFRKGGISEDKEEFSVEHNEFFFYPTYLHEHANRIIPEAAKDLEEVLKNRPPDDRVILSHYGVLHESFEVRDVRRLEALRPFHILSSDEVKSRFYYRNRPILDILLLRVYRLPEYFDLAVTPEYAGCRSWVSLNRNIHTAGSIPVLADDSFYSQKKAIQSFL